jgi:hypothetical protein
MRSFPPSLCKGGFFLVITRWADRWLAHRVFIGCLMRLTARFA